MQRSLQKMVDISNSLMSSIISTILIKIITAKMKTYNMNRALKTKVTKLNLKSIKLNQTQYQKNKVAKISILLYIYFHFFKNIKKIFNFNKNS